MNIKTMNKTLSILAFLLFTTFSFSQTKWSATFSTLSYQNTIIEDNKDDIKYDVFGDFEVSYYIYESDKTYGYLIINSESNSKRLELVNGSFKKVLGSNGEILYLDFMATSKHLKSNANVLISADNISVAYMLPSNQNIIEVYKNSSKH